jgi:hypothetical protein
LKAHDPIASPAFILLKAADHFPQPTTAINQLWQTELSLQIHVWSASQLESDTLPESPLCLSASRSRRQKKWMFLFVHSDNRAPSFRTWKASKFKTVTSDSRVALAPAKNFSLKSSIVPVWAIALEKSF